MTTVFIIVFSLCNSKGLCKLTNHNELFRTKRECEYVNQTMLIPGECRRVIQK